MYFKRIDLQGFKSFADPVSIEFHEGITCIVGPNGSGKSNISDALRWVLGEQSPKMLRGGKMEEVIFSGTANRKSRGMAEVTLVIDNSQGILPIDYNEVAITRRMYRSGVSEYAINNTACRLRDIRELIMDTGIGVDGYSIIGQGKISDIVSNKPESRREIFEEAAGIVKYRSRKAETERKLESSRANLERVDDIVSELEGRIDTLKEDSQKAREFLRLKEKQKEIEINITLKNIQSVELQNEAITQELSQLASEIEGLQKEKERLEIKINENRNQNAQLNQRDDQTRDFLIQKNQEISALENEAQLNRERLSVIEREESRLSRELADVKNRFDEHKKNAVELKEKEKELNNRVEELAASLKEDLEKQREQNRRLSNLSQKIEEQKDVLYSLSTKMGSCRSEISGLEGLRDTLSRRREELSSEEEGAKDGGRRLFCEKKEAEERLRQYNESQRKLAQRGGLLRQREREAQRKSEELRGRMEELRFSMRQAQDRRRMFQDLEHSYEGYNGAVKFLMKQKISGLEGLVAELIEVSGELVVAVETALGAGLQNVVCTDEKSAQMGISALKKARAGRLTFLPVSSIRGGRAERAQSLSHMEGYRGLAVDCVSFDSRYQKVMEYLLGRVVVVDRLDHAVAMSKKTAFGLRFVTLQGEVINAGGAITGGAYKTNTANLLSRKSEIQRLKEELERLLKEEAVQKRQMERLSSDSLSLKKELTAVEEEYRNGQRLILKEEAQLQLLSSQLSEVKKREEKRQRELVSLKEEEGSADGMIDELKQRLSEQKKQSDEAQSLLHQWIPQLEQNRRETEAFNEEVTGRRMMLNNIQNQRDNAAEAKARMEEALTTLNQQKEDRLQQIEELKKERLALTAGGGTLLKQKENLLEEQRAAQERLLAIRKQKESLGLQQTETEKGKSELERQLFQRQQKKYNAEVKLARNETQISGWKDKLWEDFEISYLQAMEFEARDFIMARAQKESRQLRARIKELGDVNVGAIREYETTKERYEFLTEQKNDILEAMSSLKTIINDMDQTIRRNFKESFHQIVINFEETFRQLFGGGTAQLRLEDETRPLDCGIEIVAQPPGKKLQNINLMSGGEKTMTAIALMFSVLKAKPTPFCILDEVEAALDEANIDRFARYLKTFRGIQFALVTHQKVTMEHADVLYGVTMPEQGISRVLSLRMGDEFEL